MPVETMVLVLEANPVGIGQRGGPFNPVCRVGGAAQADALRVENKRWIHHRVKCGRSGNDSWRDHDELVGGHIPTGNRLKGERDGVGGENGLGEIGGGGESGIGLQQPGGAGLNRGGRPELNLQITRVCGADGQSDWE